MTGKSYFRGEGAGGAIGGAPEPTARTDIVTTYHPQHDGSVVVKQEQDMEPIIEAIKQAKPGSCKEIVADAEVPAVPLLQWAKERGMTFKQIMEDNREFNRFVNDPDNSKFRYSRRRDAPRGRRR